METEQQISQEPRLCERCGAGLGVEPGEPVLVGDGWSDEGHEEVWCRGCESGTHEADT